jgi:hypothetical protein
MAKNSTKNLVEFISSLTAGMYYLSKDATKFTKLRQTKNKKTGRLHRAKYQIVKSAGRPIVTVHDSGSFYFFQNRENLPTGFPVGHRQANTYYTKAA